MAAAPTSSIEIREAGAAIKGPGLRGWDVMLWEPANGPRPLKSTGRHGHFLNSTCDIGISDMQQRLTNYSDMGHSLFLNSTCDIGENKRQGHIS